MKRKLLNFKNTALEKAESLRLKIAMNPKVIMLRLRLFGVSPWLSRHFLKIITGIIALVVIYSMFYLTAFRAPRPFPKQTLVTIERGESLSAIAKSLEEKGVIRSSFWFKSFVVLFGGDRKAIAGDYYFPKAMSVFRVANMINSGKFGLIAVKATIPEGVSSYEIAKILEKELPAFSSEDFMDEVTENNYEGSLFPDTYFFMPNTKASDVVLMMRENFARQIKPYEEDILKSERPLEDIIVMASIIEDEANSSLESKRIISGILWKRLKLEMPLQVDAPFQYYNGKNSYTLTKEDLNDDHPYNTYLNKGLPATAITNPGIDSIRAAIAPTNTDYLYFLSDKSGNMHYAKDFDGHKRNRELYLN